MSIVHEDGKPPRLQLPNFEPLPPTSFKNRVINNTLKPIFYLIFIIITSIIIIPIYTVIENIRSPDSSSRSEPRTYTVNGKPVESREGKMQQFLNSYGKSYDGQSSRARRAKHTHEHTHSHAHAK